MNVVLGIGFHADAQVADSVPEIHGPNVATRKATPRSIFQQLIAYR